MSDFEAFVKQLDASPRILLLGQRVFGIDDASNPVLRIPGLDSQDVYNACLGEQAAVIQQQMDQLGNAVTFEDEFDLFRRFPWRCIFTSAIDPTPYRLFHDAKKRPIASRFESRKPDSTSLTLFRLFGATGRNVSAELPPSTRKELANRRTANLDLIGQIPETVGPSGRLFVVGWHPSKKDWLRPRDLATPLNKLTVGQILILGLNESDRAELEEDDDFALLLEENKVLLFDSPLPELLKRAEEKGKTVVDESLIAPDLFTISVRPHTPRKEALEVPANKDELTPIRLSILEYTRLTETISIPGDLPERQSPTGTKDEIAASFLEFLNHDPLRRLVECEQFAFHRPVFTKTVTETVLRKLDTSAPQEHTVVLTGQSGSGKSIMIGLLAVKLRRAGIPVILIANRLTPPNRRHIDEFLQVVDSHSSVATAILWDGLERPEEYQRLSQWVSSLGKKALVVGTTYELGLEKLPGRKSKRKSRMTFIDISIRADTEKVELLAHFAKYLPDYESVFKKYTVGSYRNFFELIYYLTSASRLRLTAGIDAEFASHVQRLDEHFKERVKTEDTTLNAFGHALRDSYGDKFDNILFSKTESTSDASTRSHATRLVESVMVVSSYGLPMPQSIALSLCHDGNVNDFQVYQDAFTQFPIIDAYSEHDTNYFVRARLRLEAEIWVERRFPSHLEKLDVILNTVGHIKPSEVRRHRSDELEFVVRLLRAVGSQSPEKYRIPEGYRRIADCISAIEQRCGRLNPRLLLLKANSLREHVQHEQKTYRSESGRLDTTRVDSNTLSDWESCLNSAEEALGDAQIDLTQQISQSAQARGTRTMLSVLATEKAAIIGGQLICLAAALKLRGIRDDFTRLASTLERARAAWRQALTMDEDNVWITDTACWIIRNFLEECPVSEDLKYDLLAEWNELIVRYEEMDLNPEQYDMFQKREYQFNSAIGDLQRLVEIVKSSAERGNYAVHALIVRGMIESEGSSTAMEYLVSNCGDVLTTERVILLLYYRLWWRVNSGMSSYFSNDELVVAFTKDQWEQLLTLARGRLGFEGESENQLALFHAAWASLQIGRSKDGEDILKTLDTISVGNFRRGRSLVLLSNPDGQPREFTGETRGGLYSHKGKVWIEDLRLEIPYLVAQFPETATGSTLTGFHVAMNYRGAFVQPSSIYNNKRARLAKEEQRQG